MKKIIFLFILLVVAFYFAVGFRGGFAIIVRPPFGNTEAETLQNMQDFMLKKGLEYLFLSMSIALFFLSLSFQFIFKNFKKSLLVFFLFIFITNMGSIWGMFDYYYGLQSEFKYRF